MATPADTTPIGTDDFLDRMFGDGMDSLDVDAPGTKLVEQVQAARAQSALATLAPQPQSRPMTKMTGFMRLVPDAGEMPPPAPRPPAAPPAPRKKEMPMLDLVGDDDDIMVEGAVDTALAPAPAPAKTKARAKSKTPRKKRSKGKQPMDARSFLMDEAEDSDHMGNSDDPCDERSRASSEPEEGQSDPEQGPDGMKKLEDVEEEEEDNPARDDVYDLHDGFTVADTEPIEYESDDDDAAEPADQKRAKKRVAKRRQLRRPSVGRDDDVGDSLDVLLGPAVGDRPLPTIALQEAVTLSSDLDNREVRRAVLHTVVRQVAGFQLQQWNRIAKSSLSAYDINLSMWRHGTESRTDGSCAALYRYYFVPAPKHLSTRAMWAIARLVDHGWLHNDALELGQHADCMFEIVYGDQDGSGHTRLLSNLSAERNLLAFGQDQEWSQAQKEALGLVLFCHRPAVILREYMRAFFAERHPYAHLAIDETGQEKYDRPFVHTHQQCDVELTLFMGAREHHVNNFVGQLLNATECLTKICDRL